MLTTTSPFSSFAQLLINRLHFTCCIPTVAPSTIALQFSRNDTIPGQGALSVNRVPLLCDIDTPCQ